MSAATWRQQQGGGAARRHVRADWTRRHDSTTTCMTSVRHACSRALACKLPAAHRRICPDFDARPILVAPCSRPPTRRATRRAAVEHVLTYSRPPSHQACGSGSGAATMLQCDSSTARRMTGSSARRRVLLHNTRNEAVEHVLRRALLHNTLFAGRHQLASFIL